MDSLSDTVASLLVIRIPYPIRKIVECLVAQNNLPEIYAEMYRTGKKLN